MELEDSYKPSLCLSFGVFTITCQIKYMPTTFPHCKTYLHTTAFIKFKGVGYHAATFLNMHRNTYMRALKHELSDLLYREQREEDITDPDYKHYGMVLLMLRRHRGKRLGI